MYYGFKEEDKEIVYLVIGEVPFIWVKPVTIESFYAVWETYECHQALMDNQASCSSLINKIGPNIGGGATQLKIKHIELNDDPSGAFNSATTEFFSAKAKEGKSQDKFKAAITAMGDLIVSAGPPTAIGEVREEPGELFFIIGWESVKARTFKSFSKEDYFS